MAELSRIALVSGCGGPKRGRVLAFVRIELIKAGGIYSVDLYGRVRRAYHVDGMTNREAGRVFGIDRKTVGKILGFSVPPGYRR